MVLTHFNGSITTTAAEQNLFNITTGGPKHFATWVFAHNMIAGDEVEIRVYVRDENTPAERKYVDVLINGLQDDPAFFIPFIPSDQYRVSIQRTLGTDRLFTWVRAEA